MAMNVLHKPVVTDHSAPMTKGRETGAPKRPIAFFIPGLEGGGAQRVFVTLVNALVTMTDHPIHLVTSRAGGEFADKVDTRVIRVVLGHKRVSRSVLVLASYIRRDRPIAMISTLNYCNIVFLLSTAIARVPLRKVIREANVLLDQPGYFARLRPSLMRTLMRISYRYADDLIIITKDIEESLIRYRIASVDRMRRIPNPVAVEKPARGTPAPVATGRRNFILAIGRLSYQKGFDILIRAFALLKDRDISLVILGAGSSAELKALAEEQKVAERVFFPGFAPDASAYLHSAALFVLPSRWEGFSNVLAEALAVGTPIVASDCPGSPREVLDDGRLGRLVPVEDSFALAEAIACELTQPSASSEERKKRAKRYETEYIAEQYLRLMTGTELVNGRRSER